MDEARREELAAQLYRVDLTLLAGQDRAEFAPTPSYLVRTSTPEMARLLALTKAAERWPDARETQVLRCWVYPDPSPLVLSGADHLEVGDPCEGPEAGESAPEAER